MCIIIDANVSHHIVALSEDSKPIIEWIDKGGRVVIGGQNTEELVKNGQVRHWLRVLAQAGRILQFPATTVAAETTVVTNLAIESDDPHVLALARVSGARLLYSEDQNLHADFKNPAIINRPRGKVYQHSGHRHLLRGATC